VVAGVSENATFDSQPGSQGDVWDAHKGMLLATIGAMLAVNISPSVNRAVNRDFDKELAESLRIKQPNPLVEGPAYLRSD
jgi:putative membrane protein